MKKYTFIIYVTAAFFIFSCSSESKNSNVNESSTSKNLEEGEENEENLDHNNAGPHGKISLVLSGGDMPGTYEAICNESCCSYGLAEENAFGMQYSDTDRKEKELSSVQMIIEDVTGDKSTKEFIVTVTLGKLFTKESKSYTIDTRESAIEKHGSGTLDLKYSNEKATIKIKGVTAEGVKIDLSVECHSIFTL